MTEVQLTVVQGEGFKWKSEEHGITLIVDADSKAQAIEKLKRFTVDLRTEYAKIYEW